MNSKVYNWIDENENNLIEWRREIHAHPELGWQEFKTQEKILDVLNSFGITRKKLITLLKLKELLILVDMMPMWRCYLERQGH